MPKKPVQKVLQGPKKGQTERRISQQKGYIKSKGRTAAGLARVRRFNLQGRIARITFDPDESVLYRRQTKKGKGPHNKGAKYKYLSGSRKGLLGSQTKK